MYINSLLKLLNEGSIDDLLTPMGQDEVPSNWVKTPDGSYDVKWNVDLSDQHLKKLPYKFNKVLGGFYCSNNQLTSLEGAPRKVGGNFWCSNNQLTSLEGAPKEVGGDFYCSHDQLTSLEGAPKEVGGNFYCYYNRKKFTIEDVKKVCKVKGDINV
jgi:hypothetical protein